MATGAFLAGIRIFSIKSLDAVTVQEAAVLPSGALVKDRQFALRDAEGRFVHAKRFARVQQLRSQWANDLQSVYLCGAGTEEETHFSLPQQQTTLEHWLSAFLGQPVTFDRNSDGGFPDDTQAPGPTLISTATLEEVAPWYPGMMVEEARRRFRTNLEIGGVPSFWEGCLVGDAGKGIPFFLGDVQFHGVNPCHRCIVPTRSSVTAESWPDFAQTFRAKREATLPSWANRSRFNHFYRLAINTCIPTSEAGKALRLGGCLHL